MKAENEELRVKVEQAKTALREAEAKNGKGFTDLLRDVKACSVFSVRSLCKYPRVQRIAMYRECNAALSVLVTFLNDIAYYKFGSDSRHRSRVISYSS